MATRRLNPTLGASFGNTPGVLPGSQATPNPPFQAAYAATVRTTYPNAVLVEDWGNYTKSFITARGYDPSNIIHALGICSDDVDAAIVTEGGNIGQFPASMNTFLGPFMSGGLAGYPFVGTVGLGAWASHITDTGTLFITSTPHIGITGDGQVGRQFRRGQASETPSTNCGAVHGAVGWVASATQAPSQSNSPFNNGNYEFWKLADILYPYKAQLAALTTEGQKISYATGLIRDAAFTYIKDNLAAAISGFLGSNEAFVCSGVFVNTDDGAQAYVEPNQFWKYSVADGWVDLTTTYVSGLVS